MAPKKQRSNNKRKRVDEDAEEKKSKRFTVKFRDMLKNFMDKHQNETKTTNLTNFAKEHGFTFSQVKHNWYDVIVPALRDEQKNVDKAAEGTQDDERFEEESDFEEDKEPPVFKSPIKASKVVEQSEVSYLKPFRFETHKQRFFVFRYPNDHLLFEFKGVSTTERTFTITVTVRALFTTENLEYCFSSFFDLAGLTENTQHSLETFSITEYHLPKDVDLKSVQYGENFDPNIGSVFVVVFDKKVSTFIPVKEASWSIPKQPRIGNTSKQTNKTSVSQGFAQSYNNSSAPTHNATQHEEEESEVEQEASEQEEQE
ncbi:predicted protein [Naegleria gruberi]|uniref:Predicted protein n=1 Tax=Naegleria gruberi TaxID=5762 RepID=D2VV86_NAEGR|nr:uncharacterized protein NAEGRDRAFT_72928 [Naegleria gruberi]EFC39267.1 predicted protein [Naegleria gruberi]|eukprot:XP_002672011.1 predicted protein [Naegleria gruberi strain NEG-M]